MVSVDSLSRAVGILSLPDVFPVRQLKLCYYMVCIDRLSQYAAAQAAQRVAKDVSVDLEVIQQFKTWSMVILFNRVC